MIDYVLFNEQPCRLFIDWLTQQKVPHELREVEDNYEISVPEELDDELLDRIDEQYEIFLDMNQQLVEQEERDSNEGYHMAGVVLTLQDGSTSYADVDPQLLGRVMSAISPEEFGEIVNAIVDAVEKPQPKTYCQRQRDD